MQNYILFLYEDPMIHRNASKNTGDLCRTQVEASSVGLITRRANRATTPEVLAGGMPQFLHIAFTPPFERSSSSVNLP